MEEWFVHKRKNTWKKTIYFNRMVVHKIKINEKGRYIFVECLCPNKGNKSMRILIFGQTVVYKRKNTWKRTIYFGRMVVCKLKKWNRYIRNIIRNKKINQWRLLFWIKWSYKKLRMMEGHIFWSNGRVQIKKIN